jgi:hypothetical protein
VVTTILGARKTGGIYVPRETALGDERLGYMLRDSCTPA